MIVRINLDMEVPEGTTPAVVHKVISDMVKYELPEYNIPGWTVSSRELGSYQDVADKLSELTHRNWSRQGVAQTWNRRSVNGFPGKHARVIDGVREEKLDVNEVLDWWRRRNAG
jgi:hypothetical protein